jgi:hypothetical protein
MGAARFRAMTFPYNAVFYGKTASKVKKAHKPTSIPGLLLL